VKILLTTSRESVRYSRSSNPSRHITNIIGQTEVIPRLKTSKGHPFDPGKSQKFFDLYAQRGGPDTKFSSYLILIKVEIKQQLIFFELRAVTLRR
jgi:hypothetical protein